FCIIPHLRGKLVSRPIADVLREAERLVAAGVKELLVISQDTSAYGADLKYAAGSWHDREVRTRFLDLARELGSLGIWVRLHYVYPYPHVDDVIPLMVERKILPYLDVPFQHASPAVLKRMRRPAVQEKTLARIRLWRGVCPDLAIRSSFIVGFPGETETDFALLLEWLGEAALDSIGSVASATKRSRPPPPTRSRRRLRTRSSRNAGIVSCNISRRSRRNASSARSARASPSSSTRSDRRWRRDAAAPTRRRSMATCSFPAGDPCAWARSSRRGSSVPAPTT